MDDKLTILQDTTRGFSSQAERDLYNWINSHPQEAIQWLKSFSENKPEQPKKKKLLRKRPKPTMYNFQSVQVKTDRQ